jgi:hypothetical protein
MDADLVCWKCGASLKELSLPLARLDECKQCHAELHACKLCEWYSTAVAKHCRETVAEEVKDKERANFCDYFKPRVGAFSNASTAAADRAKAELDSIFGSSKTDSNAQNPSVADRARMDLENLFKKN